MTTPSSTTSASHTYPTPSTTTTTTDTSRGPATTTSANYSGYSTSTTEKPSVIQSLKESAQRMVGTAIGSIGDVAESFSSGKAAETISEGASSFSHGRVAEKSGETAASVKEKMKEKEEESKEEERREGSPKISRPIAALGADVAESFEKGKVAATVKDTADEFAGGRVAETAATTAQKLARPFHALEEAIAGPAREAAIARDTMTDTSTGSSESNAYTTKL